MAKRILTNINEPGRILEVSEIGEEIEVHPDFEWKTCEDDTVTNEHTWEIVDGVLSVTFKSAIEDPEFVNNGYKYARIIAYGDIGDQLDKIFKEVDSSGTISADGEWATSIRQAKLNIPKGDTEAVLAYYASKALADGL